MKPRKTYLFKKHSVVMGFQVIWDDVFYATYQTFTVYIYWVLVYL